MKLVFIHGWGLDAHFWDALSPLLSRYPQERIDLGFFGPPSPDVKNTNAVFVGHSLGFAHGLSRYHNWRGWAAINSFPRFVHDGDKPGCVSAAELRDIRLRLEKNPEKTLKDLHAFIGAKTPAGSPDKKRLTEGLDALRDIDAAALLKPQNVPGLVLAARNDPLVPETTSQSLAAPNRTLAWHDDGGHILPQSDPAWCAAQIADFMQRHFA